MPLIFKTVLLFLIPVFILCVSANTRHVYGQEMNSQNYKLQGSNLNSASGAQSSPEFRLVDLVGQTSAEVFTSKGFIVRSGFKNIAATGGISLSFDPQSIDFGSITPGKINMKKIVLTVKNDDTSGFRLFVAQNSPLSTEIGAKIPDAVCDSSAGKTCTVKTANIWNNERSYGFGYNLTGKNIPADFINEHYFRPFPKLSDKEQPALLTETSDKNSSDNINLLLKLVVTNSQPVGIYQNHLNFTVMPGF